jgi:uncharacterized GH25 family protein
MRPYPSLLTRTGMRWLLALASLAWPAAHAHDFWIQPDNFLASTDRATPFVLLAGHGADRQRSPIAARRITRLFELTPLGATLDLRGALHLGASGEDGSSRFDIPGAHLVVLETDNRAQSHLPAAQYNAYLRQEGLTAAIAYRARERMEGQEGSERYSRVAKALIQAGPVGKGGQDQATAELGLPLEIVLERSPYLLPRTAMLPLHVLYQGRALAGALVKLTNLDDDAVPVEMHTTDAAGQALFRMPPAGRWLFNVVWSTPAQAADGIDFETVFSSFSFGIAR